MKARTTALYCMVEAKFRGAPRVVHLFFARELVKLVYAGLPLVGVL